MTEEHIKAKVRAIYSELMGYLSQTPTPQNTTDLFANDAPWKQYNEAVTELSTLTNENFDRFKIKPEHFNGKEIVHIVTYRQTLGGLINRIHSTYFIDEPPPFSGTPQTIISQSQHQNQSIQLLLDFQSKIDQEIQKVAGDQKKEGFLKKCKEKISHVKDVNDLLKLLINTAKQFNLNLADLMSLFG